MRYVIDFVVNFRRSWEVSGPPNLSYLGCLGGLILSYLTLSYLVLSYLILYILDILVILGYLGSQEFGQVPRSGANRSP